MPVRRLVLVAVAVALAALIPALRGDARAQDFGIASYRLTYSEASDTSYVIDVWTVPDNFVNTGLAYDPIRHTLVCAHYEPEAMNEAIEQLRKRDGARAEPPIRVNAFTSVLQGIAYDRSDDTFWLWCGPFAYEQKRAVHVSRAGQELPDGFVMPGYPGMIEYDRARDGLWVKACDDHWMRLRSCTGGAVLDIFDAVYAGEGFAWDPFDGTLWVLTEATIYHVKRRGQSVDLLGTYPNPSRHWPPDIAAGYVNPGAAEGLAVDPSDHTLWMNADQHIHGGIPGGNRCWHIDPLGTFDQDVRMPMGMAWERGRPGEGVRVVEDRLEIAPGSSFGTFVTPIVDLGNHVWLADSVGVAGAGGGAVRVEYRGSQTPPTSAALEHLTRPYYDANEAGEGWGATAPGAWSEQAPPTRFLQARITMWRDAAGVGPVVSDRQGGAERAGRAWPNPFTRSIHIDAAASGAGGAGAGAAGTGAAGAGAVVYDVAGQRIRALDGPVWDGRDERGRRVAPGVYIWRAGTWSIRIVRLP